MTGPRTDINEIAAAGQVFVGVSRAALEALFDTFASGGQLIQPNETVAYVGIPAAPQG